MKNLIILLVLTTALRAAEIDTPKPVQPPPAAVALVSDSPAATATSTTPAVPPKRACGCEATGGRAALLTRAQTTTPTPTPTPTSVVPPSR